MPTHAFPQSAKVFPAAIALERSSGFVGHHATGSVRPATPVPGARQTGVERRAVDSGAFQSRMDRVKGEKPHFSFDRFDAANDVHVDEVARALLERFREHDDVDAFQLLFEVTFPKLSEVAAQVTRRLNSNVDPDDLVSGFMTKLYTEIGRRHEPVRRFLALAYTTMRNDALDHKRHVRRAQRNDTDYSQTLATPADPAEMAELTEQDRIFEAVGGTVLEVTSECFHRLDDRDQQVLIAREIAGLPYDSVARMLKLQQHQVGMIIRRARINLADLIVERLTDIATADSELGPKESRLLQDTVVRSLESKGRAKNVQTLVEHMLATSKRAAKERLAALIYEMAKACLIEHPGFSQEMSIHSVPRRSDVVADDIRQIQKRVDDATDVSTLVAGRPEPDSALANAFCCLEALKSVEGESGRQQVAWALSLIYDRRPQEAEVLLRRLETRELPSITRQNVSRNLTLALLRQGKFEEALESSLAAADEWPEDPVRLTNVCTAAARLQKKDVFEQSLVELVDVHVRRPSDQVATWLQGLLRALAEDVGVYGADYDALLSSTRQDERE